MPYFLLVLLALTPLAAVLYLMIGRNWGGSQAGPVGWLVAILVALLFFGANLTIIVVATGKAILLSLYVLYIIWMALFLYHVVNDAGAIKAIGQELPRLARQPATQALLLAWIFGAFLQGASGFGVPAAVVAPLLVGLGFVPTVAVAAALIGHAWAVTFGSLGASYYTLIAGSGVPGEVLASPTAFYMGICCFCCGFAVLWSTDKWRAVRQQALSLIILTLIMAGTQWLLALMGLWSLAAFGAGLVGLIVMIVYLRWQQQRSPADENHTNAFEPRRLLAAFFPYMIMTLVIVLGQLVFKEQLALVELNWDFPETVTTLGHITPAGPGRSINLFGHAGALLLYSALLAYGWYKVRGTMDTATGNYRFKEIVIKTIKGSRKSTISVFTLVAMATTMDQAGMTQVLAEALSQTGLLFPFLSPFIGALGAFMTGSNTNSNVVFADLQTQTALALGLTVPIILAAQTAGGAIGSAFAPAKVIVGCSTVEGAQDGAVLRLVTIYGLIIITVLGVVTLLLSQLSWLGA